MTFVFEPATNLDAVELAVLHHAAALELTRKFGQGPWSLSKSALKNPPRITPDAKPRDLRQSKFSQVVVARAGKRVAGTLHLATKKPWAIDTAYFTAAKMPLYLTSMAVHPDFQGQGVGRFLLRKADAFARAWPGDAIRLDAFDAVAGAGPFYAKCGYREVGRVTYKGNPLVYFERVIT